MYIGADYYPEHWPEERWERDAELMEQAGFNITRLAEFSWAKLEPNEGEYDFAWLDRAIGVLGGHGVRVIMCTPTPTMPKWVYDKYPEVTAEDREGRKLHFGNRQNNCFSSGTYRRLSQKITTALAEHYKDNKNVIAWQLDNEFGGPECFCGVCEHSFREWLRKKYGAIQALNEAYGTIFWSHTYGGFHEVHLPRHGHSSPSLELDYRRFHSENVISFAGEQEKILREICPHHLITHNLMGFAPLVDYYELSKLLDFVSFDYYYNGYDDKPFTDHYKGGAAALDLMRSVKHKNYWIMENSAGALGWECYGRNLRPGEMRRMTYQNVAHGGDGQIWFRWRTSRYGTEQYWHGILGHDGLPGRRYREAAQVSGELHELFKKIEGTAVLAEAAIMLDYNDRWAFAQQPNSTAFRYEDEIMKYHDAFSARGMNVDFISPADSLEDYRLLVMPVKYILEEELSERLDAFVKAGGVLITTFRSGVKNDQNVPHDMTLPGFLRDITGVRVEEYEAVIPKQAYHINYQGCSYTADTLVDWVIPEKAEVLAAYDENHMCGYAAITSNAYGRGKAFYIGASLPTCAVSKLIGGVVDELGLRNYGVLEDGLEIVTRSGTGNDYAFVLNHSDGKRIVSVVGTNVSTGERVDGMLTVPANDIAIIETDGREIK